MKLFFTAFLAIFTVAVSAQTPGYKVGDAVADFNLKNIDGRQVSMAGYNNVKGYIVIFTCNTCPYSVAYEDRIIALNKKFSPLGYPVIAINPNDPAASPGDSFEKMQQRAKDKGFTFPYLMDPDHLITRQFGASKTPHTFVVQKSAEGNKVAYIGAIDNDTEGTDPGSIKYTEQAMTSILDGKKPALNFTKAVGCTIKWKKVAI